MDRTFPRVLFNTEVQIYNRDDARSSRYFGIVLYYVSDADIAPLSYINRHGNTRFDCRAVNEPSRSLTVPGEGPEGQFG